MFNIAFPNPNKLSPRAKRKPTCGVGAGKINGQYVPVNSEGRLSLLSKHMKDAAEEKERKSIKRLEQVNYEFEIQIEHQMRSENK